MKDLDDEYELAMKEIEDKLKKKEMEAVEMEKASAASEKVKEEISEKDGGRRRRSRSRTRPVKREFFDEQYREHFKAAFADYLKKESDMA